MTKASRLLVFIGVTVMAACACGAGSGLASIGSQIGLPANPGIYYATLLSTGAAFLLWGLRSGAPSVLPWAGAALLALLGAGLLAPPRVMRDDFVHSSGNLFGFVLYLAAVALLILTLSSAYRSRLNGVEAAALAGAALAAGCTCCLTPGAVRYAALQTGVVPAWMVSRLALVLAAAIIGGAALYRARGGKAFLWFGAGIVLVYPVERLVEWAAPSWSVSGANLTFLLRYPVWLIGTGCVMYAASRIFAQSGADARRLAA